MVERERQAAAEEEEARRLKEEEERKQAEAQQQEEGGAADGDQAAAEGGNQDATAESGQKRVPGIEVTVDDDIPDAMNTINSSKKLLSENMHSVGATSRSIGRSTKFFQRVQEINDR